MATNWIEKMVGPMDQKRKYREYKARAKELPEAYRVAFAGIERYLMYAGGIVDGEMIVQMTGDLLELLETAAAEETPIRTIVGDEPEEFVTEFVRTYASGAWINKERERLNRAIAEAEGLQSQ